MAVLLGAGIVWVGYEMYVDITGYENNDSDLVLNVLIMMAYDLLGKWGAPSAWTVIAGLVLWLFCFSPAAQNGE